MMNNNDQLKLVETIVEKTGVSYTEAKDALERSGWDLLNAITLLESEGKSGTARAASFTTKEEPVAQQAKADEKREQRRQRAQRKAHRVGDFLSELIEKGNRNFVDVLNKEDEVVFRLPLTVFVIFMLISFGSVLAIMIISLFFGIGYRFSGSDVKATNLNNVMDEARDAADSIKKNIEELKEENKAEDNK